MSSFINIYTDGSCFNNGKKNSSGGIGVFFNDNDDRNISTSINDTKITNQRMELIAVLKALEKLNTNDKAYIYTDSTYVKNCLTKWIRLWENNDWKKMNNNNIENLDLILEIKKVMENKIIIYKHIKAHQNEPNKDNINYKHWYGNKKADELAFTANKNNIKNILTKEIDNTINIINNKNEFNKLKKFNFNS